LLDAVPAWQDHLAEIWHATRGCAVFVSTYPAANASAHLLASGGPVVVAAPVEASTPTLLNGADGSQPLRSFSNGAHRGRVLLVPARGALSRSASDKPEVAAAGAPSKAAAASTESKVVPTALYQWMLLHAALRAFKSELDVLLGPHGRVYCTAVGSEFVYLPAEQTHLYF